MLDMTADINNHWDEYMNAIEEVVRSGQFILGPQMEEFERDIASYLGAAHTIGVNSGTDALVIALLALGIGEGDEVLTTPYTFFATAEAISHVGATPVFIDIEQDTFNIDTGLLADAITERTAAILPVHLFGRIADMDDIMALAEKSGLPVVEDSAQALGAEVSGRKAGTWGSIGTYSFFPSKTLGGFGDGGLLSTDDATLADLALSLRSHGSRVKYQNERLGFNSRLDTIQAAILQIRLRYLDEQNEARRHVAAKYFERLSGIDGLIPPDTSEGHVFHQYTLRILDGRRDGVIEFLTKRNVSSMIYYPVPVHRLPVYQHLDVHCPVAERVSREALSLPLWPHMPDDAIDFVSEALKESLSAARESRAELSREGTGLAPT